MPRERWTAIQPLAVRLAKKTSALKVKGAAPAAAGPADRRGDAAPPIGPAGGVACRDAAPPPDWGVQKLGRNRGGYRGETIVIEQVLAEVRAAARRYGWREETLSADGAGELLALRRPARGEPTGAPAPRVYVSAGIHGDEPAGPLAVSELLTADRWPPELELYVCPCLNPTAFPRNRRESAAGVDLNRDYRTRRTPEVRAHTAWLTRQPAFDLALCLHEDWEANGFYLYELNPDARPSTAERVVAAVAELCPIDRAPVIDGRPARDGIIRPVIHLAERPDWPEAFYLLAHKTRHSYTLEAPSDFPLATRVSALTRAVEVVLTAGVRTADRPAQTVAGGGASR